LQNTFTLTARKSDMSELVTLELPENVARNARDLAKRTDRRVEDILVDWLDKAAAEIPVESLPDEEILALCEKQLDDEQQAELSLLLEQNREGILNQKEQERLDKIMRIYRRGLVRKAQAWDIAVARGLKTSLN
jgi:flagellar motility protein MotE (MotC chaperone)